MLPYLLILIAFAIAGAAIWAAWATRAQLEAARIDAARSAEKSLQDERRVADAKQLLAETETRLKEVFQGLAGEALRSASEELRKQSEQALNQSKGQLEGQADARKAAVEQMTKALAEQVEGLRKASESLGQAQRGGEERLGQMLRSLGEGQEKLGQVTQVLNNALSNNQSKGQLGELVLEQLLQWAGLQKGLHYRTQVQVEGKKPDVLISLPDGRELIIDSKMVMDDYLAASREADPKVKAELFKAHAQRLKATVKSLAGREYRSAFPKAADFVILFLPNDSLLSSALEADPSLLEYSMQQHVSLMTPASILPLLKVVDRVWLDSKLAENAREIAEQAGLLLDRLYAVLDHLATLGKGLKGSVDAYNSALGSLDSRVYPQMKKVRELGVSIKSAPSSVIQPLRVEALPETERVQVLKHKAEEQLALPASEK